MKIYSILALSLLALTACSQDGRQSVPQVDSAAHDMTSHDMASDEATELDQALIADNIADDVVYLTQLGLMRGHLFVGVSLYREGEHAEAATHMKHPESELYAELRPGLQQRAAPDFSSQLEALATAVETVQSLAQVEQIYEELVQQIHQAEAATTALSATQVAQLIKALLDNVAEEYAIAVDPEGQLLNVHEYQDSLGFVEVANQHIDTLQQRTDQTTGIQGLRQQMAFLQQVFAVTVPSASQPLTLPATVNDVINRMGVTLAAF